MLHTQVFGEGNAIVILHGLFGSGDNWRQIAKALSETYNIILIDLPNHGRSHHTGSFTYTDLSSEVFSTIEKLKLNKPTILGHSMGGKVAMQLVHDHPDAFKALIVADIVPKIYPDTHSEIFKAMFSLDLTLINSLNDAQNYLQVHLNDSNLANFLLKNLKRQDNGSYNWLFNLKELYNSYKHILNAPLFKQSIQVPTLFIYGEKSDYMTNSDKPLINAHFEHVKFKKLVNAGHWLHTEKPKDFVQAVIDFVV